MQILTYMTIGFKDKVKDWFKQKEGSWVKVGRIFSVWLILFLSKFIFLEVISLIFREEVYISGFLGLLLVVVCLTISQKLAELAYNRLAD
jgi:hypothetical protein